MIRLAASLGVLLLALPARAQAPAPALIPMPLEAVFDGDSVTLPHMLRCRVHNDELIPLLEVMDYEYRMLGGGGIEGVEADENCELWIDHTLVREGYRLETGAKVWLSGGSYQGVAWAASTLAQLMASSDGRSVARGRIIDAPASTYRGILVDPARKWHEIEVLEQMVRLCRWYKISTLHLHLTDDQLFTFPTETLPALPTPGFHYTKEELRALDEFARRHGVTLLPEIEMPGHSSNFVRQMPEVFGIREWEQNTGTMNMGREAVYEALDGLLGEVAEVFQTSPFIHMGGDETSFHLHDEDPDTRAYMERHGLADVNELYRHFIGRINDSVRRRGRQLIVWEGFQREGAVEIPRNVVVMAWETIYQLPQDLLEGGYSIINVSWQPLYVVNERKWWPETIYRFNFFRWENWVPWMPSFEPIQLDPTNRVIGASMASWDQAQEIELFTLRKRLGAFGERAWTMAFEPERSWEAFEPDLRRLDEGLSRLLTPLQVHVEGLRFPDLEEGQWNEHTWFGDALTIRVAAPDTLEVRFTVDGTPPQADSPLYETPIRLDSSAHVRIRAFAPKGAPLGHGWWERFTHRPIRADVQGDFAVPLDELWYTLRSWEANFTGEVRIALESDLPGQVHYSLDGSQPSPASRRYEDPIVIEETAAVRAQLFVGDEAVGEQWLQHFRRLEDD